MTPSLGTAICHRCGHKKPKKKKKREREREREEKKKYHFVSRSASVCLLMLLVCSLRFPGTCHPPPDSSWDAYTPLVTAPVLEGLEVLGPLRQPPALDSLRGRWGVILFLGSRPHLGRGHPLRALTQATCESDWTPSWWTAGGQLTKSLSLLPSAAGLCASPSPTAEWLETRWAACERDPPFFWACH